MAAAPESKTPAGPAGLVGMLRTVTTDGQQAIYAALASAGCVAPARLACTTLRTALDGCVRGVHLERCMVGAPSAGVKHEPDAASGAAPSGAAACAPAPLGSWPRCSKVHVTIRVAAKSAAAIVPPLQGAVQLARVTHLTLHNNVRAPPDDAEQAAAQLVQLLPSLRVLDLSNWEMSYTEEDQAALYEALASCPHLEELVVPSTRSLEGMGPLAASGSLRRIHVANGHYRAEGDYMLCDDDIAAIRELRTLQELTLDVYGPNEEHGWHMNEWMLSPLLEALPSSMQLLTVGRTFIDLIDSGVDHKMPAVQARLEGGWLRSLHIGGPGSDEASPAVLAAVAQMLLKCRAMPKRLSSFKLLGAEVSAYCSLLPAEHAAYVKKLLKRCDTFSWSLTLDIGTGTYRPLEKETVLQLLGLLGVPEALSFNAGDGNCCTLSLPTQGNTPVRGRGKRGQDSELPAIKELLRAAVRRLATGAAAPAGGDSSTDATAADAATGRHVLVLTGPWIEAIITSDEYTTLRDWLRKLGSSGSGGGNAGLHSYIAVSPAGALVVACCSAAAASAAADAAQKAADVEALVSPRPMDAKGGASFALWQALAQELQERWAPVFVRSPCSQWARHVEWLLPLTREVAGLQLREKLK